MANLITFLRVIIAMVVLIIIKINPWYNLFAILLIVISMVLDAADGYVARLLNSTTPMGSIFDILADRIIENIFFIYFSAMSLFNVWFAVIIMIRGLTIDAIRTIFAASGKTAFGKSSLHTQNWTKILVCSKFSRGTYNTFKMSTFICFSALLEPEGYLLKLISLQQLHFIAELSLWITTGIALLRAIPVIVEGWLAGTATQQTSD